MVERPRRVTAGVARVAVLQDELPERRRCGSDASPRVALVEREVEATVVEADDRVVLSRDHVVEVARVHAHPFLGLPAKPAVLVDADVLDAAALVVVVVAVIAPAAPASERVGTAFAVTADLVDAVVVRIPGTETTSGLRQAALEHAHAT